jgi:hypothetical protein
LYVLKKVGKPIPYQLEAFSLKPVNAHPALPHMSEQAGLFEDLKMAGRGLPGMLEDGCDFTGRHGAAIEVDGEQHPPPGGVRQGPEDKFIRVESRVWFALRHSRILSHKAEYVSSDIKHSG